MTFNRFFTEIDYERVDDLGFLDQARSPRLCEVSRLLTDPVAWILGRPWIGKSTVAGELLKRLKADPKLFPGVERRVCLTRVGSPDVMRSVPPTWWESWTSNPNPTPAVWIIDGIDEVPDFNRFLLEQTLEQIEAISDMHLRNLRLLLFSRPYNELEWVLNRLQSRYAQITTRSQISKFWLTRLDRTSAIDLVGVDRIDAVEDLVRINNLQAVSGYPVVLEFLKNYRHEAKSLTVADVWQGVLKALLGQPQSNYAARFKTSLEDRFVAACRVATVLTFIRRETIREWSPDPGEATIGTLFQSPNNSTHLAALEACKSALFSPSRDPVEYRLVQRNAQDWLTAFALKKLPLPALTSALGSADGMLPARLREVARLLLAITDNRSVHEAVERLVGGMLLPSDAIEPSIAEVIRAIDHLEELADRSPWGLHVYNFTPEDLARLRVDGLGANLSTRLRDPGRTARVKQFLLGIARATQAAEVVDVAVYLVLESKQDDELRYIAIWIVAELGGPGHLAELEKPIGESLDQTEIECRIRAVLVQELLARKIWPYWKAALNSPKLNSSHTDSRDMLLRSIEKEMGLADARHLLPHLRELWKRHAERNIPHRLPGYLTKAVDLVLCELQPTSEDLDNLIQFIGQAVSDDSGFPVARNIAVRLKPFTYARRRLFEVDLGADKENRVHAGNLLAPEDWSWLRDKLLSAWSGRRDVCSRAYVLALLAKNNGTLSENQWSDFIQFVDVNFPGLSVEIEEGRRKYEEEMEAEAARHRESEARDPSRRPLSDRIHGVFARDDLSAQDLMRNLSWLCFYSHVSTEDTWTELPHEIQNQVLMAFRQGLEAGLPLPLPCSQSFSGLIVTDAAAFSQVVGSVDHTDWLSDSMIRRWLPITLFARVEDPWNTLIAACRDVSVGATEDALLEIIEFSARNQHFSGRLGMISEEFWTVQMVCRLAGLVSDPSVPPDKRSELLNQLARLSPRRADPVSSVWAMNPISSGSVDQLRKTGLNLLLTRNPAAAIALVEVDFTSRGALALEELPALRSVCYGLSSQRVGWTLPLLGRLESMLLQAYPIASDPDSWGEDLPPDWELREARNQLLWELMSSSEEEAGEILNQLEAIDPEVQARVESHRVHEQAARFLPGIDPSAACDPAAMSVQDVVRLLDREGYRLIRSPDDLLEAVTEALHAIQSDVGHDLPMLYSAPTKGKGKAKGARTHLHEDALQAYLRRRLLNELPRIADGIEVQIVCEDQVAHRQRLDLRVTAPRHGGGALVTVVVEIKWSTNKEVKDGLVNQLGGRYLLGERLTHGVFLVGWSGSWSPRNRTGMRTDQAKLMEYLTNQRDTYSAAGQPGAGLRIIPFVLDVQWSRAGA